LTRWRHYEKLDWEEFLKSTEEVKQAMPYTELVQKNAKAIRDYVGYIEDMINGFARGDKELFRKYALAGELTAQASEGLSTLPTEKVLSAADQIRDVLGSLEEELRSGPSTQTETFAMLALNSIAVLEADLEVLDTTTTNAVTSVPAALSIWQKIKNAVKNAIKAISQHLWQIVCTALTLKEWTVKGSLGSSIFGLGSVEISLKFGK
jgi:hypothetical protein